MPTPVPDVRPVGAHIARLWIKQGRLHDAQLWADENELYPDDTVSYSREYEYLVLARLLIASYRQDHNEAHLEAAHGLLARLIG